MSLEIALDTNLVIAALVPQDAHHARALRFLKEHAQDELVLPAAVYAELLATPGFRAVKRFLEGYKLSPVFEGLDAPRMWELAGERFGAYAQNRRSSGGGPPRRILADFLIGAQVLFWRIRRDSALATLDPRFYRRYFPEVPLYDLGGE